MLSRRSLLVAVSTLPLAGCAGESRDVLHVERVDTVTLGDGPLVALPALPESLGVAIANVLRRNATSGRWRLDGDPGEDETLAAAIDERPVVATRGQRYHLNGIYASFEYDADADEIAATAVFPTDAAGRDGPPQHAFESGALPGAVQTALERAIAEASPADLGEAHEYAAGTYDGAYIRHEGEWYRTNVETLA